MFQLIYILMFFTQYVSVRSIEHVLKARIHALQRKHFTGVSMGLNYKSVGLDRLQ